MNALLLLGAVADAVAVAVHGGVGHRWMREQLSAVNLPPSDLFGDADVGVRVFGVTWHAVTGVFVVCAATLALMAFGGTDPSDAALGLIAAIHAAAVVVAALYFWRRLDAFRGAIPPVFAACMSTVVATTLGAMR